MQERKSTWHFGHLLSDMICGSTIVPQREQRATWRDPIMRGLRAPSDEMRRAPAGRAGLALGPLRAAAVGARPGGLRPIAVVVLVAALAVLAVVAHGMCRLYVRLRGFRYGGTPRYLGRARRIVGATDSGGSTGRPATMRWQDDSYEPRG